MPHRDPEAARLRRREYHRQLKERDPDYQKRMYRKHREKRLAAHKAKREEDLDGARARQRAMYAKHREKRVEGAREYRRKNRERLAAEARERYHANAEKKRARAKELRQRPESRKKAYAEMRRWLALNPEKAELMHAKRLLNEQTGVRFADIPDELVEVKVEQLNVSRLARDLLFPPPYKKENEDGKTD